MKFINLIYFIQIIHFDDYIGFIQNEVRTKYHEYKNSTFNINCSFNLYPKIIHHKSFIIQ